LLERKVITAELFDEEKIVEVFDPEEPKRRYCLCRNPQTAGRKILGKTLGGFVDGSVQCSLRYHQTAALLHALLPEVGISNHAVTRNRALAARGLS